MGPLKVFELSRRGVALPPSSFDVSASVFVCRGGFTPCGGSLALVLLGSQLQQPDAIGHNHPLGKDVLRLFFVGLSQESQLVVHQAALGSEDRGGFMGRSTLVLAQTRLEETPERLLQVIRSADRLVVRLATGGTNSRPVNEGTAGGIPPGSPACARSMGAEFGLAAAYLQSPRLIMHAWTTSFPWYRSCTTRGAVFGRTSGSRGRYRSTDAALGRLSGPNRTVGSVPAVAGLEQRVGGERGELFGPHELVDHVLEASVVGEVEVVYDLGALVAEVPVALEPRRSGHVDLLLARCRRRFVGLRTDRTDGLQVRQLRLEDAVHLLREVRLAGGRGPVHDVRDGLGATDHDRPG
jgi:hypothetical protein